MACKRYLPPNRLAEFLKDIHPDSKKTIGFSVENRSIEMITIGTGSYTILMWSQMHGNESTTTKALFDFIPWFLDSDQELLQAKCTLYIIPQLNPDGSHRYTRQNASNVDLNRDAIALTQPESSLLRRIYEETTPDLCLNLHGQRTIYAAGKGGPSASLSFLAPAANRERTITPARKKAMNLIVGMCKSLAEELPDAIGRYDDTFNPNCVGDSFTQSGTPTILFEAGHVPGDYQREQTRIHILNAYKALFYQLVHRVLDYDLEDYLNVPQNSIEFVDLIISDVNVIEDGIEKRNQKMAIQFRETLENDTIYFYPEMVSYGDTLDVRAHQYTKLPTNLQSTVLEFKSGKLIQNEEINKICSLKTHFKQ